MPDNSEPGGRDFEFQGKCRIKIVFLTVLISPWNQAKLMACSVCYCASPRPHAALDGVCLRRWKALGVLELIVPLLFEVSHVLLRESLSTVVRGVIEEFLQREVVGLLVRRVAVWTSLNRSRPWEYDRLESGLKLLIVLVAMPAAQMSA